MKCEAIFNRVRTYWGENSCNPWCPLITLITTKNNYKIIRVNPCNPWTIIRANSCNPWTNHKDFDIEFIKQHSKLIVDMRNMVEESSEKVFKL